MQNKVKKGGPQQALKMGVGKCLGTAVTAVRPIIGICIPMMSKKEGFYL